LKLFIPTDQKGQIMLINIRNPSGSVYKQVSAATVEFLKQYMVVSPEEFRIPATTDMNQLIVLRNGVKLPNDTEFENNFEEVLFICKDPRFTEEWFNDMEEIMRDVCSFIDFFSTFSYIILYDRYGTNDKVYRALEEYSKKLDEYYIAFNCDHHLELIKTRSAINDIRMMADYCHGRRSDQLLDDWMSLKDTTKWHMSTICSSLIKICKDVKEEERLPIYKERYASYCKFDVFNE